MFLLSMLYISILFLNISSKFVQTSVLYVDKFLNAHCKKMMLAAVHTTWYLMQISAT